MALVLNDRVRETSTTSGTGTLNLAGAVTGWDTFVAGVGTTNTTYYAIHEEGTANWEVGTGTVTDSTPDTLSRTAITSSNSDNLVSFGGGTLNVFCTLPASKTMDMTLTTAGDILYASANNTPARLAKGTALQVLQMNSGASAPEWATASTGATNGFVIAMSIALQYKEIMAQNFKNYITRLTGTTPVDALGGATNSIDCLISVRMANVLTTTITVEAYIERGGSNYYLIKNAPIVSGGSLELIDGGSKIVLASGDQLYAKSDTASSLDTVVGAVDDISSQENSWRIQEIDQKIIY